MSRLRKEVEVIPVHMGSIGGGGEWCKAHGSELAEPGVEKCICYVSLYAFEFRHAQTHLIHSRIHQHFHKKTLSLTIIVIISCMVMAHEIVCAICLLNALYTNFVFVYRNFCFCVKYKQWIIIIIVAVSECCVLHLPKGPIKFVCIVWMH